MQRTHKDEQHPGKLAHTGTPFPSRIWRKSLRMRLILIALVTFSGALHACQAETNNEQPGLHPITVQLSWSHYASYGGLYAADQEGYYAEQGLSVSFLEGGPDIDHLAAVLDGQAQFGVLGADELILARSNGHPVRAIAVILRRSPIVFVAKAETGITRPEEFVGKTIRVTSQLQPTLRTIMAHIGISPDQYTEIVLPSDLALFDDGPADVWGVYFNSFAVALQAEGHELNFIFPDDYGAHFYSDTIFTTDEVIEQEPELVAQFISATMRGLSYAIEHPDDIGRMVLYYAPDADLEMEMRKAIATIPLISSGNTPLGDMEPKVWASMHAILLEQDLLTSPVDIESVYTRKFVANYLGANDEPAK